MLLGGMIPTAFRVQMFKNVIDSGWVDLEDLTVIVGKNEAGKTTLLKALHKFKPFENQPYKMDKEWPRGRRDKRNAKQVVCSIRFKLAPEEKAALQKIGVDGQLPDTIQIDKTYDGNLLAHLEKGVFPDSPSSKQSDGVCTKFPAVPQQVGAPFIEVAREAVENVKRLVREGQHGQLPTQTAKEVEKLNATLSPEGSEPQRGHEQSFVTSFKQAGQTAAEEAKKLPTVQRQAHEYICGRIPTFIYMDEYRAFRGSAFLDQVKQRIDSKKPTPEDETLLMILKLAGLDLNQEVEKSKAEDRTNRRFDLSDAGATLTKKIAEHWKQLRYEVELDADASQFFTFVKGQSDPSRIELEERSKGFQWFFSFDLLFMHETQGKFKGCVLLLDEPGLHLHPQAQRDLLRRLQEYADGNTLIYSTHLPFMIDLHRPECIRVLSEGPEGKGALVSNELTNASPEAKLVLRTALEIGGGTSYLLADDNLVVEGVDDYWLLTALSNLFKRAGKQGLPESLMVTAAGGASEVTYISTIVVGQELRAIGLYDSDAAGNAARTNFVNKWLTKYKGSYGYALSLGEVVKSDAKEFAIEDLFDEAFYLKHVQEAFGPQLTAAGASLTPLAPGEQLCKRVEKVFADAGLKYNKGSVAKRIQKTLASAKDLSVISNETVQRAEKLFNAVIEILARPIAQA